MTCQASEVQATMDPPANNYVMFIQIISVKPNLIGICLDCGKEFKRKQPHQKYCDRSCHQRIHQRRHRHFNHYFGIQDDTAYFEDGKLRYIRCQYCGLPFNHSRPDQKYCSSRCIWKAEAIRAKRRLLKNRVFKKCPVCYKDFISSRYVSHQRIFCSRKCQHKLLGRINSRIRKGETKRLAILNSTIAYAKKRPDLLRRPEISSYLTKKFKEAEQ